MSLQDSESSDTSDSEGDENDKNSQNNKTNSQNGKYPSKNKTKNGTKEKKRDSIFTSFLGSLFDTHPFLKSIDGRAATVHNFMRGLSLYKAYPFSPFTSIDDRSRNDQDKLQGMSSLVDWKFFKVVRQDSRLILLYRHQGNIITTFDKN